ncbi:MAG: hypothetical protein LBP30_05255 [Clostridiales Family XIII bacterium]|nr:hypothetical protein [Clostridiales Family XIII bacterium]
MNDEKIAKAAANRYAAEHPADIRTDTVKIGEASFEFEQTGIMDDKVKIFLPAGFSDMPEDAAKIKYPSSDRPKIIKSNDRGDVNFTFDTLDCPLDDDSVADLTDTMKNTMKRLNPSYRFFGTGKLETPNEKVLGFMEFKSTAIDDFLYNVMFFAPLEGRALMGNFCCPYGAGADWKPVVMRILSEIEIGEEKTPC